MKNLVSSIFSEWHWRDYVQFIHSVAFVVFGLLILLRLSGRINFLGGLIGAAFLLFGLYRLNFFFRNAVSHLRSAKKRDTAG